MSQPIRFLLKSATVYGIPFLNTTLCDKEELRNKTSAKNKNEFLKRKIFCQLLEALSLKTEIK